MAWKGDSGASFSGGSGQMAVMAELLHRKCNAAVPHIDVGMDVFAFRDDREEVARIQVKTALAQPYKKGNGYHAKFPIPMAQLERTDNPKLFYALATRLGDQWASFIVISRADLHRLWKDNGLGSENKKSGDLELHVQFRMVDQKLTAKCGKISLTDYINAWETLPPLKKPVAITAGEQIALGENVQVQIEEIDPELPQA